MSLADEDVPRAAIHEASHAVIAVEQGFFLYAVMLNGPAHKPGAIWREFPVRATAENDAAWAAARVSGICCRISRGAGIPQRREPGGVGDGCP